MWDTFEKIIKEMEAPASYYVYFLTFQWNNSEVFLYVKEARKKCFASTSKREKLAQYYIAGAQCFCF